MRVLAHQSSAADDMVFHLPVELRTPRPAWQRQYRVERERSAEVAMIARRRFRSVVFYFSKVVSTLSRHHRNRILPDVPGLRVHIEEDPMIEGSVGGIGIIQDESEA